MLGGCGAAGAVVDLASLPVRGASKAVDVATVSQSESDERRGREIRRREERLGELDREYRKQSRRCADGSDEACRKRDAAYAEMCQSAFNRDPLSACKRDPLAVAGIG